MASGINGVIGIGIEAKVIGLENMVGTLEKGLDALFEMRQSVREHAYKLQAQAVANVSGVTVQYSGGSFLINRRTGKLVRSIQITQNAGVFSANVVASANYASAIEGGTGQHDLKPLLMGKTIVFQFKGSEEERVKAVAEKRAYQKDRKTSTGKPLKTQTIEFRKVGPKSQGWIVPAQKKRPFMQAAAETIQPLFTASVDAIVTKYLNNL